ncbi:MAG: hypothetical protein P0S95_00405 [Rhabdochlamydiaceae bacterium]|nr:hypothetical protein [Candidatus Amphrikana amoebophyrae]
MAIHAQPFLQAQNRNPVEAFRDNVKSYYENKIKNIVWKGLKYIALTFALIGLAAISAHFIIPLGGIATIIGLPITVISTLAIIPTTTIGGHILIYRERTTQYLKDDRKTVLKLLESNNSSLKTYEKQLIIFELKNNPNIKWEDIPEASQNKILYWISNRSNNITLDKACNDELQQIDKNSECTSYGYRNLTKDFKEAFEQYIDSP